MLQVSVRAPKVAPNAVPSADRCGTVISPGDVEVQASVDFHTCPGNVEGWSFDFSYGTTAADGSQSCHPCPEQALDGTGMESCPAGMTCEVLVVPGTGGGLFQASGMVNGRQAYTGNLQAQISWEVAPAGRWTLQDAGGVVRGSKASSGFDEGWTVEGSLGSPFMGIR